MKTRSVLRAALVVLFASLSAPLLSTSFVGAQTAAPAIVGAWRADAPLPNGVVQTFRFDSGGRFDLAMALAVDGSFTVVGNKLIETVTLPSVGITHTDTATFSIAGDSLLINERAGAPARVLHRSGTAPGPPTVIGDWTILVGSGMAAHYVFARDGTMHVRADVGDEKGRYTINADTLHLSNDKTFQLPAIAQFVVADSVLTLTPQNGKAARRFHRVGPR
jgi:uncharacterized protein DUF5640